MAQCLAVMRERDRRMVEAIRELGFALSVNNQNSVPSGNFPAASDN
jgi:hypothetical protein